MQKSNINPAILQQMLDSAVNAGEKGQSQFFTPLPFGQALATALPARHRPVIVDLNCGAGHLLQASALPRSSPQLLGADIDPCRAAKIDGREELRINKITHDATLLYPLLREVQWEADLFVLNPPWRLYWHRDRLQDLAESELSAVRRAFASSEPAAPRGTIDSTIATLLMALDRCTARGEGLLIANNNTLERLIFREGAPHAAIAEHIWAHLVVPGNPMSGLDHCNWEQEGEFHTGILYFARGHTTGPRRIECPPEQVAEALAGIRVYRKGADLMGDYFACGTTTDLWYAVKEQVARSKKPDSTWNIWLENGVIKTQLSLFEQRSVKVNKHAAARLNELNGQAPMELILQRAQRDDLLQIIGLKSNNPPSHQSTSPNWRVQPALIAAVQSALTEYHAARAPLYPLSEIQRLGYLDEQDSIQCRSDLGTIFKAGQTYPIRTQTVGVERKQQKPNAFTGAMEDFVFDGQQLAIFIKAGDKEYSFMDAVLKADKNTRIHEARQVKNSRRTSIVSEVKDGAPPVADKMPIDFTLQELCTHFIIPAVPDVATVNPAGYEHHLNLLTELEQLTESLA